MSKNILFITHTDKLGAGKANVNIAKALQSVGYQVQFLVAKKTTSDPFIEQVKPPLKSIHKEKITFLSKIKNRLAYEFPRLKRKEKIKSEEKYILKYCFYNEDEGLTFYNFNDLLPSITIQPDIIIGGWISYFVNLETIGEIAKHFNAEAFLLMNDMAHLTGGCHYHWECEGYKQDCSNCPALEGTTDMQRSQRNLSLKKNSIKKYNIQLIAATKGNVEEAKLSTLFKSQKIIKNINGSLNFDLFNPNKRNIAKQVFDIPKNSKVILAGSSYINDPRKGFDKLVKIFELLSQKLVINAREVTFMLVGDNNIFNFDFPHINFIRFDSISHKLMFSLLYQAADVYVSPSVEDAGPVMVAEALASGTPVIGFPIGFVKDFIINEKNGYIIPEYDLAMFAEKIYEILFNTVTDSLHENSVNSIFDSFSHKQFENFF